MNAMGASSQGLMARADARPTNAVALYDSTQLGEIEVGVLDDGEDVAEGVEHGADLDSPADLLQSSKPATLKPT
jgi:hypothetical protein